MSDTKLQQWHEMAQLLKKAKFREAELRRELCKEYLDGAQMTNGRVTVKGVEDHLEWKAVQALGYTVDDEVLRSLWSALTPVEKDCIKYKPNLGLAAYKKLDDDCLIHEAVTTKLAMPTLSVDVILDDHG